MRRFIAILCAVLMPMSAWGGVIGDDPAGRNASDRESVAQGNNAFAADLYGQLRSQNGNLFFSPQSISTALAMTYAGARGNTAAEMAAVLHFTLDPSRLHPAMREMIHHLNAGGKERGYQFKVANALWAQQGYSFSNDFLALTKNHYGADLTTLDFITAAEPARLVINRWVEEQTDNKIRDLIPPGVLNAYTRLVLTNAVYFKGVWQRQFDKAQTRDEDFHVTPTQNVRVPLMHATGDYNYLDGDTFQALELPYNGKNLSLILFLPRAADGLAAFEQLMSAANLREWLGKLRPASGVALTMPRFKVTAQFDLNSTLTMMGMRQAFGSGADFSGMTGSRDLYLSNVIHKAYVDVNEEGTEAAAATAVAMHALSAVMPAHRPPVFRADHPLIFLIRDNPSGSILFMGRVNNPA